MTTSTTNTDLPINQPRNAQELANLVQITVTQIQEKFGQMSDSIIMNIDDMGRRIDTLERNLAHLISQTNTDLP